jgi:hypothetical protein
MNLDEIMNRILVEERLKKEEVIVEQVPVIGYRCEEHGYSILYNDATEIARYTFDGQAGFIETDIPLKQRNYYVDSGYWKLC